MEYREMYEKILDEHRQVYEKVDQEGLRAFIDEVEKHMTAFS